MLQQDRPERASNTALTSSDRAQSEPVSGLRNLEPDRPAQARRLLRGGRKQKKKVWKSVLPGEKCYSLPFFQVKKRKSKIENKQDSSVFRKINISALERRLSSWEHSLSLQRTQSGCGPHGLLTSVPGNPRPSFALQGQQACTWYTEYMCSLNTQKH